MKVGNGVVVAPPQPMRRPTPEPEFGLAVSPGCRTASPGFGTSSEKVGVGMLTTRFDGGLRARPLEPRLDRVAGVIRFVTDIRGAKDDEVEAAPDACFIVIEPEGQGLSFDQPATPSSFATATSQAGYLGKDRRRLVAGWPRRSERARAGIPRLRRPSSGTVRQARSSRRSNLPRRGSLAKSRTSGENRKSTVAMGSSRRA